MTESTLFIYQDNLTETVTAIYQLMKETNFNDVEVDHPIELKLDSSIKQDFIFDPSMRWIIGRNPEELFHGLTKFIFMMHSNYAIETMAYKAKIKERCVMIDIGRKFYSLHSLKKLVRSMAWFQFTHLQLHFSENEGFRIESEVFPEIVSTEYLTKMEIKELIAYAKGYYIEIIPDLDSPGHLQQVLHSYPEWQLPMVNEEKEGRALNILHPKAVQFMKSLYQEYAELFCDSTYFHIGGDEFINFDELENYPRLTKSAKEKYGAKASGIEVFIDYVNEIIAYINELGFTTRVWNDGFYRLNRDEQLSLSKRCQVSYWTRWNPNMAPVSFYFKNGYQVINHNDNFFYYVLGEAAGYTYPTYEKILEEFELTTFANHQIIEEAWLKQTPAVALAIWADIPDAKTSQAVIEDVFWIMAAMHQKIYGLQAPKDSFNPLYNAWKQQ